MKRQSLRATTNSDATYKTVFDFADAGEDAVSKFERIDDAIMGGISLSALKQLSGEEFARWSGICRLDGGGFCGARTLPFKEPLKIGDADGLYLICRLTSDDEPEKRIWKLTTRSEQSRGEQLYQAMFELPKTSKDNDWNRVTVPFSSFVQVRGPRLLKDAPALNATGGLFQIGMSLSKFQIAENVTELDNFRPGFFELQLKEIGVYKGGKLDLSIDSPTTLAKKEADQKRPLIAKIALPIVKLVFSEKRRRRKSAMRLLRERGFSRFEAIMFGIQTRGLLRSATLSIEDGLRTLLFWTLKLSLFYPILAITKAVKFAARPFRSRKTDKMA